MSPWTYSSETDAIKPYSVVIIPCTAPLLNVWTFLLVVCCDAYQHTCEHCMRWLCFAGFFSPAVVGTVCAHLPWHRQPMFTPYYKDVFDCRLIEDDCSSNLCLTQSGLQPHHHHFVDVDLQAWRQSSWWSRRSRCCSDLWQRPPSHLRCCWWWWRKW